jgi:hypothetical protein
VKARKGQTEGRSEVIFVVLMGYALKPIGAKARGRQSGRVVNSRAT